MKIRRLPALKLALALVPLTGSGGCGAEQPDGLSELAQKGQLVYQNVCIACHNANPALDGSVGPANAGASIALLEAKILRGEYPPGYTPKRPTAAMPKFDYLADQIPALHAYLNEVPQTAE